MIGFGRMGVTHFALLNTHPEVRLTAVCDASSFVLKNLQRFSDTRIFTDAREMLREAELDFVIIATPTAAHAEAIEAAISRGLHVFVEKPFALTVASGQRLVDQVNATHCVNQVGYFLRFNEMFELVKEHLEARRIGTPLHYRNEMYGRTVLHASKSSWRSQKSEGGGCLLDFASHCIDLSNYLFGAPCGVRGSLLKNVYSENVEDAAYATLLYDNGLSGHLMVNWSDETFRRPYNRIEIVGTKGKIVADRQECRLFLREADESKKYPKGWSVTYLPERQRHVRFDIRGTEFTAQLDHFIDCIQHRCGACVCTFADGLRADRVIEAIQEDARGRSGIPVGSPVQATPRSDGWRRKVGWLFGRR
jgi:predicted dehydrogenase